MKTLQQNHKLPFVPVDFTHQELVNRYMKLYGGNSCQHSFVNLFTLVGKYDSCICEWNGFLLTLRRGLCKDTERVYLAPIGKGDLKAAYEAILADAKEYHCKAVFQTVTKDQVDFLKSRFPGVFEYSQLRDYAEYIYDSANLSKMSGSRLSDKRNKVNQIMRLYGDRLTIKKLSGEMLADVWNFEEKWLEEAAESHDAAALELEKESIRIQLEHFEALELSGIGIYYDQEMVGFAYGVALNDHCFDGLIAKTNRRIKNLYKLLYKTISQICAAPYPLFNWEEDVGVSGLRDMKMEYDPIALIRKYLVREREHPVFEAEPEEIPVISSVALNPREHLLPDINSEAFSGKTINMA